MGIESSELLCMVLSRNGLFKEDRHDENQEEIDKAAEDIWSFVKNHQNELPIEDILEAIASLGAAPSIINDDNGHWTIGEDGIQNMPTCEEGFESKETTFDGTWFVPPGGWHKTIREAIRFYLEHQE